VQPQIALLELKMTTKTKTETIGSRIGTYRREERLSISEFGKITDIPVSSLKKYESNISMPGGEAIQSIAKAGINAHWLLTGKGQMLIKDIEDSDIAQRRGDTLTTEDMENRKNMIDMLAETTNNPDQVWAALLTELMADYDLGDNANKRIMETMKTLKNMK